VSKSKQNGWSELLCVEKYFTEPKISIYFKQLTSAKKTCVEDEYAISSRQSGRKQRTREERTYGTGIITWDNAMVLYNRLSTVHTV
jgi:hypothetical protein